MAARRAPGPSAMIRYFYAVLGTSTLRNKQSWTRSTHIPNERNHITRLNHHHHHRVRPFEEETRPESDLTITISSAHQLATKKIQPRSRKSSSTDTRSIRDMFHNHIIRHVPHRAHQYAHRSIDSQSNNIGMTTPRREQQSISHSINRLRDKPCYSPA